MIYFEPALIFKNQFRSNSLVRGQKYIVLCSVIASTEFQPGDVILDITPLTEEPWETFYKIGPLTSPVSMSSSSPPAIKRSRSQVTTPASVTYYSPALVTPPHVSPMELLAQAAENVERQTFSDAHVSATSTTTTATTATAIATATATISAAVTEENYTDPLLTTPVEKNHLSWANSSSVMDTTVATYSSLP